MSRFVAIFVAVTLYGVLDSFAGGSCVALVDGTTICQSFEKWLSDHKLYDIGTKAEVIVGNGGTRLSYSGADYVRVDLKDTHGYAGYNIRSVFYTHASAGVNGIYILFDGSDAKNQSAPSAQKRFDSMMDECHNRVKEIADALGDEFQIEVADEDEFSEKRGAVVFSPRYSTPYTMDYSGYNIEVYASYWGADENLGSKPGDFGLVKDGTETLRLRKEAACFPTVWIRWEG